MLIPLALLKRRRIGAWPQGISPGHRGFACRGGVGRCPLSWWCAWRRWWVHRRGRVLCHLGLPDHRDAVRGEHHRRGPVEPLLRGAGPPTAAGVGHGRRRTAIGSAVLFPRWRFGASLVTGSPARYMSATTGSLYKASTTSPLKVPLAVSALLVSRRRGTVLLGVAADDHRNGVAHPAYAAAHRSRCRLVATPYFVVLALVAAVSFISSLVATHEAPSVAFFSLPTRAWELAVGGLVALRPSSGVDYRDRLPQSRDGQVWP